MDKKSTPYFFQYTYFAGKERSIIANADISFDHESWFSFKINSLIAATPDVPDEIVKRILKKANLC